MLASSAREEMHPGMLGQIRPSYALRSLVQVPSWLLWELPAPLRSLDEHATNPAPSTRLNEP